MEAKFIILGIAVGKEPDGSYYPTNAWYDGKGPEEMYSRQDFDTDIRRAVQYNTYEEAVAEIANLPEGIYQIDKIFVK